MKHIGADKTLYRYSITIQEQVGQGRDVILSKPKKKRLIQLLLTQMPFTDAECASDWSQLLISTTRLQLGGTRKDFDTEWYAEGEEAVPAKTSEESKEITAARKRNTFKLLVGQIDTISLAELVDDISNASITYPAKPEAIQALNILMAYGPSTSENMAVVGQNQFFPVQRHPQFQFLNLGGGLQALRGYYCSVRTSIGRILVNVNVATKAFYKKGPLLDVMRDFGKRPRNKSEHARLNSFVHKLQVETNYLPQPKGKGTKRTVRVIWSLSPFNTDAKSITFNWIGPNNMSKKISVNDFFRYRYGITLQIPDAPVVNYGTDKDPKWIPAELCTVLPGQLARRVLEPDQTRQMIGFAARRPNHNAQSIIQDGLQVTGIRPVADGFNVHLKKFGIKVGVNLLTVPGRILPAPVLSYRSVHITPKNGAWNLDTRMLGPKPFRIAKSLPSWNCLIINADQHPTIEGSMKDIELLLEKFRKTLEDYGMTAGSVQKPEFLEVDSSDLNKKTDDPDDNTVQKVQHQIRDAISKFKRTPKFLFIILPSNSAILYDCIKYVCDVQLGIPNICNIGSKFCKAHIQYFSNVALKFNQKLGGVNHKIQGKGLSPLDDKMILFGIDVTHPSPGSSETAPSIAGVVASIDSDYSQYPGSIRTQAGREEMVQELGEMVVERLQLWQKENDNRLPTRLVVYRDGVSNGQYQLVIEKEYPTFVAAFKKLYGPESKHPKVTIIVVGKRHHTRFYPTKAEHADQKTGNPHPGTVVDRGVTGEKMFDFFLLAHQGLQGTSRPAHYVVIKDDNKFGADQLQVLTNNLCYTFARATRSVSVCTPAYCADLLCERGRSYIHEVLKGNGSVVFDHRSWKRGGRYDALPLNRTSPTHLCFFLTKNTILSTFFLGSFSEPFTDCTVNGCIYTRSPHIYSSPR
jgi:hypothetical protein